jgi:hypothetical protein
MLRNAEFTQPETVRARTGSVGSASSWVSLAARGAQRQWLEACLPDAHQRLSENSICALKPGEIGEVYGRKTLAIPPILSIQMLFSDSLLEAKKARGDSVKYIETNKND